MHTLNFANLSASFKHLGNHSAQNGNDAGQTGANQNRRAVTVLTAQQLTAVARQKDQFIPSQPGPDGSITYGKPVYKAENVHQNAQPAQSAETPPATSDSAEFIPTLTMNGDGTATMTNANGTTTLLQPLTFRPDFSRILSPSESINGLTVHSLPPAATEALQAYRNFYEHVIQELASIFPELSSTHYDGSYMLSGSSGVARITQDIFAMAQISNPFGLYLGEGVEDFSDYMTQFESFRTQVTQGLQELREINEIRNRLAFEGDQGMFSSPLDGPFSGNVIPHIILGTNGVKYESPLGAIMARGQSTDLNWLRQVDQVATKEGLQAAFTREHNYQEVNGAYVPTFAYYDWEKGTQTLITINITYSLDNYKTMLDEKDKPFTITVTEYSLKDPNDKGKTIAEASGKDYFAWLDSDENFLPHIGDAGFQNWRKDFVDRASGWGAITTWLGSSNSQPAKNSFHQLSKLLGLEGTHMTKGSLLDALNKLIDEEGKELNKLLTGKLKEAGMEDVTKKITFAEDKEGNIVIEGNLSKRQKKQLAKLINDDPELVERIKTQKARQEFARGIEADEIDDKKYDAARTQLLKDVLAKHSTSLDDLDRNRLLLPEDQRDEKYADLYNLLASSPGLHDEIWAYMDRRDAAADEADVLERLEFQMPGESLKVGGGKEEKSTAVRSLLAMKRGELSEAVENNRNFDLELLQMRASIFKSLDHVPDEENPIEGYNATYYRVDPDWVITDFDMEFDHEGKLRFSNVQTAGGCEKSIQAATRALHSLFSSDPEFAEVAKDLGLAILESHDDVHGDVEEFKHKVVFEGGIGNGYRVESKEADEAAMQEIGELLTEIGSAFGDFFTGTLGIENPFAIIFGGDGKLSLDVGGLNSVEARAVKNILSDINKFLAAEESGEEMEGMLSPELTGIGEKLLALQEAKGKIHDQSLLPKEGWRLDITPR